MIRPDVALVTGADMPAPDTESPLLVAELARLGLRAEVWVWREPHAWEEPALVLCRTPWDYFEHRGEFLRWMDDVAGRTRFENAASLVRWNSHKSYLVELAAAGVPVVPTRLVRRGASAPERAAALAGAARLVVKPAVSVSAIGARRGQADDPGLAGHLDDLARDGDALVQPLVASVAERGEVSLVLFDGVFSHAVRKVPAAGDYRVQEQYGGTVLSHEARPEELAIAGAVLAALPGSPIYARVDLVQGDAGPLLMEAELIEPFLFLGVCAPAASRFAAVVAARAG